LLLALARREMIEQDTVTKRYRRGPALVRLARIRESAFPLVEIARPKVDELSAQTSETVHVSELIGDRLTTVYVRESSRANRVGVEIGEQLPFNCTASGLAILAFSPDSLIKMIVGRPLVAMTKHSLTTEVALKKKIDEGRRRGFTTCDQGYEEGVFSVAAPILSSGGHAIGAISVASPVTRIERATIEAHGLAVKAVAIRIADALGMRSTTSNP
jgi:DNA-binding IclR family transcriptional regulator